MNHACNLFFTLMDFTLVCTTYRLTHWFLYVLCELVGYVMCPGGLFLYAVQCS